MNRQSDRTSDRGRAGTCPWPANEAAGGCPGGNAYSPLMKWLRQARLAAGGCKAGWHVLLELSLTHIAMSVQLASTLSLSACPAEQPMACRQLISVACAINSLLIRAAKVIMMLGVQRLKVDLSIACFFVTLDKRCVSVMASPRDQVSCKRCETILTPS
jgi:hypothetical protein